MSVEAIANQREVHVADYITPPWRDLWQELKVPSSFADNLRDFLQKIGFSTDDKDVSPFTDRQNLIEKIRERYRPNYTPQSLSDEKAIRKLAKACGFNSFMFGKQSIFRNEANHPGWGYIKYPVSPGLTEDEAIKLVQEKEGEMPTLNDIMTASLYNKVLTGKFLFESQMIRVLGTKLNGKSLSVGFDEKGEIFYGSYSGQSSPWLYTTWFVPCART